MIAIFPEIAACVQSKEIDRLVLLVRRYFAGETPFRPVLDCQKILEDVGIRVEVRPMEDDAILCVKDEKGAVSAAAFVTDRAISKCERNFLLGHVLGHFFLHVQPKLAESEWRTSGLRESFSPLTRYCQRRTAKDSGLETMEKEADNFAASLLLPMQMVTKAFTKLNDLDKVANFFEVDLSMLKRRLFDLNIGFDEPSNFISAEEALGAQPGKQTTSGLYSDEAAVKGQSLFTKAFAASTYSDLEKRTATTKANPTAPENVSAEEKGKQGMERIRNLARRIDKSVE